MQLLTVKDVAEQLGVDQRTVLSLIANKSLAASNIAPRASSRPLWRIRPEAIEAFLALRQTEPKSPPQQRRRQRPPEGTIEFIR
jgi:excisionase family DNA binding protein